MFRNTIQFVVSSAVMFCGWTGLVNAQDCGCASSPSAVVADQGCGCGTSGNFLGNLRTQAHCDPAMRTGLWDGYCSERKACNNVPESHFGFGRRGCGIGAGCGGFGGLGGCNSGCGSIATGCDTGCGAVSTGCGSGGCDIFGSRCGSGNCGHIFGGRSCFRHDGHFFGNFRAHHGCETGCEAPVAEVSTGCSDAVTSDCGTSSCGGCDTGCRWGGHHRGALLGRVKGLFQRSGSCGCGHFDGGCGEMNYAGCGDAVGCGCGN